MRSKQVHRALLQVPNRYALCQTISRSARLLHKTGNSIDGSLNTALEVLSQGSQQADSKAPAASSHSGHSSAPSHSDHNDADSLYRKMQYSR